MHSHLTQWIEEADARQFCLASSWHRVPATNESHCLHLGETILKVPARVGSYALACARRVTRFAEDQAAVTTSRQDHFPGEPTLSDLLQDPITQALMAADHVDRSQLDTLLEAARGSLPQRLCPGAEPTF
jgi:hypothetical protein